MGEGGGVVGREKHAWVGGGGEGTEVRLKERGGGR